MVSVSDTCQSSSTTCWNVYGAHFSRREFFTYLGGLRDVPLNHCYKGGGGQQKSQTLMGIINQALILILLNLHKKYHLHRKLRGFTPELIPTPWSKYPKKICSKRPLYIVFIDLFPNWHGLSLKCETLSLYGTLLIFHPVVSPMLNQLRCCIDKSNFRYSLS